MGFTDSGWKIANGVITIPEHIETKIGYRFILEAIVDGHIPVTRVAGYCISTTTNITSSRDIRLFERNVNCSDDRLSIAANLSKLLIPIYPAEQIHSNDLEGRITIDNIRFMTSNRDVLVLSSQEYIVSAIYKIRLDLALSKSIGYKSGPHNFDKLMQQRNGHAGKTRFFPIESYHCLRDFIRVLPNTGERTIRLKYYNGMSDFILLPMLEDMFSNHSNDDWADKYMEVFK